MRGWEGVSPLSDPQSSSESGEARLRDFWFGFADLARFWLRGMSLGPSELFLFRDEDDEEDEEDEDSGDDAGDGDEWGDSWYGRVESSGGEEEDEIGG